MHGLAGDPLAIFLALFGGLVTLAVGATYAAISTDGWKARALWAFAVVFALISAATWFLPSGLVTGVIARAVPSMLPGVGLFLVVLYAGPKKSVHRPVIAQPQDAPNVSLTGAVAIISGSEWAEGEGFTFRGALIELRDKLLMKRVSAFGRKPGGDLQMIRASEWKKLNINPEDGAAVSLTGKTIYTDLQFNRGVIEQRWPEIY